MCLLHNKNKKKHTGTLTQDKLIYEKYALIYSNSTVSHIFITGIFKTQFKCGILIVGVIEN
jgi:hypothetical protein